MKFVELFFLLTQKIIIKKNPNHFTFSRPSILPSTSAFENKTPLFCQVQHIDSLWGVAWRTSTATRLWEPLQTEERTQT